MELLSENDSRKTRPGNDKKKVSQKPGYRKNEYNKFRRPAKKIIFIQFPETLWHINVQNIFLAFFTIFVRYLAWMLKRQNRDVDTASETANKKKRIKILWILSPF